MKKYYFVTIVIIVFTIALFFRLYNLGYSDFQGDEVKALIYINENFSFPHSLFINSKGAGQYFITTLFSPLIESPDGEFWARLPFSLSGLLLVIITFFCVKRHFSKTAAVIAAVFLALSGLLIAFSRITQYQSFVLLLSISSVFFTAEYLLSKSKKHLLLAGILGGLGLIFHYDSLSFIIPITLVLLAKKEFRKDAYIFILPVVFALVVYIPLLLSPNLKSTLDYLYYDRALSYFHFDSVFYSVKLLSIYHSKEYLIILLIGLLLWGYEYIKNRNIIFASIIILLLLLIIVRFVNVHPRRLLIYPSTVLAFLLTFGNLIYFKNKKNSVMLLIETWFLFSLTTYFLFFNKPLTHIYSFMIPVCIIVGIKLGEYFPKHKYLVTALISIVLISSISFNYQSFIETKTEYPWQGEKYILGSMYKGISEGENVRGIFGFPYNRSLNTISKNITQINNESRKINYYSNEKFDRIRYYVRNLQWNQNAPYIYIHVNNAYDGENEVPVDKLEVIESTPDYTIYIVK